ncbi:MAG: RluA family pseudouridine synthase [Candidatus Gastranaerophilales bacterium]|nr:RluA family pseudouridine synthase [Candidatus Gastranaerophilales bacterium]
MNNKTEPFKIIVDIDDAGNRLDILLSTFFPDMSRNRIQQLIKESNCIIVNDNKSKSSYKVKFGDEITVNIPEAKPLELTSENIPLDIRFEDVNMIVVNKPAGMLTHPTSIEKEHTLVNALLYHCQGKLSGINGIMRPGILHRLDRDTSGLLMIAKNDYAHQFLSDQIKTKTARRQYLAILHGVIKEDTGTINEPIDRHLTQRHKMGVVEGGKSAVTHWKVIERFDNSTFIEATLETGRTHQIRVHFSHIHHPVAGDPLYGGNNINIKLHGQALQAYRLTFINPTDKEKMTIEIEPEDDIKKLIRILRKKETI